jgi:hypothetical protein
MTAQRVCRGSVLSNYTSETLLPACMSASSLDARFTLTSLVGLSVVEQGYRATAISLLVDLLQVVRVRIDCKAVRCDEGGNERGTKSACREWKRILLLRFELMNGVGAAMLMLCLTMR